MSKKSKNKGTELTIFIICAFLVVFGLFFIFLFDFNIKLDREANDKSTVNIDSSSNLSQMNTNDALDLLYLYEYPSVLTNNDTFLAKSFYYKKDKLYMEELSDESKILMTANNLYKSYLCDNKNPDCYVKELDFLNMYKKLFGNNSNFNYVETNYVKRNNDVYIINCDWKSNSNGTVYFKVNDAYYNDKILKIFVKVAFQHDTTLYYNADLTNVVEELSTCKGNDDLDKYDNLRTYIYTFNIENNNYVLEKVERK